MIEKAANRPYTTAFLGGLAISLFPAWFVTRLSELFPSLRPEELEVVANFFSEGIGPVQIVFFMIITFVMPPLEELVFRGWLWKALQWKLTPYWAWIATSLLFAAIHMEPLHVLGLLPLSFFLGWLRMRTGDINASVLAHMTNNAVACLLMMV